MIKFIQLIDVSIVKAIIIKAIIVATYISYTSHSYTYMHIKIKQNYFKKYFNFVYLYNFFSYLDIFSLDNDSFELKKEHRRNRKKLIYNT